MGYYKMQLAIILGYLGAAEDGTKIQVSVVTDYEYN